jgi:hypothetical protein
MSTRAVQRLQRAERFRTIVSRKPVPWEVTICWLLVGDLSKLIAEGSTGPSKRTSTAIISGASSSRMRPIMASARQRIQIRPPPGV